MGFGRLFGRGKESDATLETDRTALLKKYSGSLEEARPATPGSPASFASSAKPARGLFGEELDAASDDDSTLGDSDEEAATASTTGASAGSSSAPPLSLTADPSAASGTGLREAIGLRSPGAPAIAAAPAAMAVSAASEAAAPFDAAKSLIELKKIKPDVEKQLAQAKALIAMLKSNIAFETTEPYIKALASLEKYETQLNETLTLLNRFTADGHSLLEFEFEAAISSRDAYVRTSLPQALKDLQAFNDYIASASPRSAAGSASSEAGARPSLSTDLRSRLTGRRRVLSEESDSEDESEAAPARTAFRTETAKLNEFKPTIASEITKVQARIADLKADTRFTTADQYISALASLEKHEKQLKAAAELLERYTAAGYALTKEKYDEAVLAVTDIKETLKDAQTTYAAYVNFAAVENLNTFKVATNIELAKCQSAKEVMEADTELTGTDVFKQALANINRHETALNETLDLLNRFTASGHILTEAENKEALASFQKAHEILIESIATYGAYHRALAELAASKAETAAASTAARPIASAAGSTASSTALSPSAALLANIEALAKEISSSSLKDISLQAAFAGRLALQKRELKALDSADPAFTEKLTAIESNVAKIRNDFSAAVTASPSRSTAARASTARATAGSVDALVDQLNELKATVSEALTKCQNIKAEVEADTDFTGIIVHKNALTNLIRHETALTETLDLLNRFTASGHSLTEAEFKEATASFEKAGAIFNESALTYREYLDFKAAVAETEAEATASIGLSTEAPSAAAAAGKVAADATEAAGATAGSAPARVGLGVGAPKAAHTASKAARPSPVDTSLASDLIAKLKAAKHADGKAMFIIAPDLSPEADGSIKGIKLNSSVNSPIANATLTVVPGSSVNLEGNVNILFDKTEGTRVADALIAAAKLSGLRSDQALTITGNPSSGVFKAIYARAIAANMTINIPDSRMDLVSEVIKEADAALLDKILAKSSTVDDAIKARIVEEVSQRKIALSGPAAGAASDSHASAPAFSEAERVIAQSLFESIAALSKTIPGSLEQQNAIKDFDKLARSCSGRSNPYLKDIYAAWEANGRTLICKPGEERSHQALIASVIAFQKTYGSLAASAASSTGKAARASTAPFAASARAAHGPARPAADRHSRGPGGPGDAD